MDELMAAMVLSRLSCSPLLHSPAHPDNTGMATLVNKTETETKTLNKATAIKRKKVSETRKDNKQRRVRNTRKKQQNKTSCLSLF